MKPTYFHSKELDLPCKIDDKGTVTVKELNKLTKRSYVEYNTSELDIINKTSNKIEPYIHNVKSMFDGTLVNHKKLKDLKMKGVV